MSKLKGIIITTFNRPNVLRFTVEKFKQLSGDGTSFLVVDDCSSMEHRRSNFQIAKSARFNYVLNPTRMGIANSKNVGLNVMRHCDYQFWFDDDCFPINRGWEEKFTTVMDAGQGHCLYLKNWAHVKLKQTIQLSNCKMEEYNSATGCLMTFKREMYDDVAGFNDNTDIYAGTDAEDWHPKLSGKMKTLNWSMVPYGTIEDASKYINAFDIDHPNPRGFVGAFHSTLSLDVRKTRMKHMPR